MDSLSYLQVLIYLFMFIFTATLFAQSRLMELGLISFIDLICLLYFYVHLVMIIRSSACIGQVISIQIVTCCGFELVRCKQILTELGIMRQMQAFGLSQSQPSGGSRIRFNLIGLFVFGLFVPSPWTPYRQTLLTWLRFHKQQVFIDLFDDACF